MVHATRMHETGGPEVMKWEEVEVGDPGPGEIRVKQSAAGLNFIDIYLRSGARPVPCVECAVIRGRRQLRIRSEALAETLQCSGC